MAKETVSTASTDIDKIISELKQKEIDLPDWETKLKHEYFPSLHPVMTDMSYRDKPRKNGTLVKVTRATRGLQRRAVNIMSGMMFGIPVKRVYSETSEQEKKAAAIMEAIYEANRIETVNIERGNKYNAACEVATLWYGIKEDNDLYGEKGRLKIRCRNFSPMSDSPNASGENIYPKFDEYGDMVALSFEYTRKENGKDVLYFDTYSATEHFKYRRGDNGWEIEDEDKIEVINKIPSVYIYRHTPIWEDSNNVYEIEWSNSRNGNYIRRNSIPPFHIADDEEIKFGGEQDDDERLIIQTSSNGKAAYATWDQAIDALKYHIDGLEKSFFSDIQLPNFSDSDLHGGTQSGESKKYWFVEAILKVIKERGPWLEFLSREVNVIKAFAKLAFPDLAKAFDSLRVKHIITPFEISNEKDTINNIVTAVTGNIASKRTGVERLGWVKDVDKELSEIKADSVAEFTESTE